MTILLSHTHTQLTRGAQYICFAQLEDGEVDRPDGALSLSALSICEDTVCLL